MESVEEPVRTRVVREDRIRTLNLVVVHEGEAPNGWVKEQMVRQCAVELTAKLFEHHKVKTVKREDGRYSHYVLIDIIVPERTTDAKPI